MEQTLSKKTFDLVGKTFPRKDGIARVTGREIYTCTDGGSSSCRLVRHSSVACESAAGVLDARYGVACRNATTLGIPADEVV